MVVRERILLLMDTLLDLMAILLDQADENLETVMPDYTYLQAAQPTTFAHYLLNFVQPITRDLHRLLAAYNNTNRSPAGAGSTNGSRLPLDRDRIAELLGFEGIVRHARDAMWQPDGPIEVMSAIVAMMINVNRLAEDLQIWATAEFDFVELADRHSRISVIMPQKKNPYSLAFVRGVARDMIGWMVSSATVGATPSGQVDNRIFIYGDVPKALDRSRQAIRLLSGTVAGLSVNREQMALRSSKAFSGATDLSDVIMVSCQIDSYTAHRIVGNAIRRAIESDGQLTAAILDEAAGEIINRPLGLNNDVIARAMNPEEIIKTRTGLGGASPDSVQMMIDDFRGIIEGYRHWLANQEALLHAAESELLKRARDLCQST
jgi:argininosuccinate lyase